MTAWAKIEELEAEAQAVTSAMPVLDGMAVLKDVERFVGRFVAYPSEAARIAHVLWIAHAHMMDAWESTPRLAFLSPEPASGKSRALEVTELLVPRAVLTVNATAAYVFRRVSDEAGPPTVLADEIDTVFGPKARDNEELRGFYNAGHRRGAVAGRCIVRGKTVETEELPAYCAVALAGLGNLPDTILTRSVIVRMRRRAPGEMVESFRRRLHEREGADLCLRLAEWGEAVTHQARAMWPALPEGIEDRLADVWEPLVTVADLAGGDWPERARVAAVALVADVREGQGSLGLKLLADCRTAFADDEQLPSAMLVDKLIVMEESPWGDLRGKTLDARGLARLLAPYGIKPTTIRTATGTPKGYRRIDFNDAWQRYAPLPSRETATAATSATGDCPRCEGTGCGWCEQECERICEERI